MLASILVTLADKKADDLFVEEGRPHILAKYNRLVETA